MKINAWLIHRQASGDTSVWITLFTRELGLVRALCKGGRMPKKQAELQVFTPLWVVLDLKRDTYFVRQVEAKTATLPLSGTALLAGWYLNEIINLSLRQADVVTVLFDGYGLSLHALALAQENLTVEKILRRFECQLLQIIGYALCFTHVADLAQPIIAGKYYVLQMGRGFILAEKGIPGEHLLAIACDCLDDVKVLHSAKIIMRQALHHALDGVPLHTRNLFR